MVVLSPITKSLLRGMTPATSNTMILGVSSETAALNVPTPLSLRLVTCLISPPRPPVTYLPWPSAPGNAGTSCANVAVTPNKVNADKSNCFFMFSYFYALRINYLMRRALLMFIVSYSLSFFTS